MKKNIATLASLLIILFSFYGTVLALPISSGSEVYESAFGDFTATLHFDVYNPNDTDSPLYGLIGSDEYAYIYKICNSAESDPDYGKINKFNLGYETGVDIINFGTIDDSNPLTVSPSSYAEEMTQFVFLFLGGSEILPDACSQRFYVTSHNSPALHSSSSLVGDGGDSSNALLTYAGPGDNYPVPEPATLLLLSSGLLLLFVKRKKI